MNLNFSFVPKYLFLFFDGARSTLVLAFFTVILGVILGIGWALLRLSRPLPLRALAAAYVEFIRGTPIMVQMFIIFYGLPALGLRIPIIPLFGDEFPRYVSGIITLSINSAAYVAEIIRAGIQAVDKGQTEAARSLGMTGAQCMFSIVLPQAIKNILPALGNEFVTVIKESSVVSIIGIGELMYRTQTVGDNTYRYIEALIIAACLYFVMTYTTSRLLALFERRMARSERGVR